MKPTCPNATRCAHRPEVRLDLRGRCCDCGRQISGSALRVGRDSSRAIRNLTIALYNGSPE